MDARLATLEGELVRDLQGLSDRLGDSEFCAELYRALTNRTLTKDGPPGGYLVLSWDRAEEFVNEMRAGRSQPPISLAQSGGEGVISETVSRELERQGWRTRPLSG